MFNWSVVLIASAIVLFWSLPNLLDTWVSLAGLIVSVGGVIISASCLIMICVISPLDMSVFEEQKRYIEGKGDCGVVEDAALTNKKIELNDWLYSAQMDRRRFGEWSVYPDSVLDMTPIE